MTGLTQAKNEITKKLYTVVNTALDVIDTASDVALKKHPYLAGTAVAAGCVIGTALSPDAATAYSMAKNAVCGATFAIPSLIGIISSLPRRANNNIPGGFAIGLLGATKALSLMS